MLKLDRNAKVVFSVFAFLSLVTLACGLSAPRTIPNSASTQPPIAVEVVKAQPTAGAANSAQVQSIVSEDQVLVDMYSRLNPSVVNITVYASQSGSQEAYAQGSGFVFDTQGHIVTNNHVVEGSDAVEVTFSDGLIREASLVGVDVYSDLAVVKVDLPAGVKPIPLGKMENVDVGQTVVAIGNPFGLKGTLTKGVVSALGRSLPTSTQYIIPEAIQTDASINPGNSGGPLLNLNGEVIGVNAQIETSGTSDSSVGVGFAIPVSILERVVPALIKDGKYDWPYLGVQGGTIYPALVKAMKLPVEQGAYVDQVISAGPAEAAGLRGSNNTVTQDGRQVDTGGDVITAINGQPVKTFDDLLVYLTLQTSPGQEITLTILRDGNYQDVKVTLGTRQST